MKTSKKLLALALAGTMVVPTLVGCGDTGRNKPTTSSDAADWYTVYKRDFKYDENYNQVYDKAYNADTSYNQDLYYLNEFKFKIADPTVIYIDHGEEAGYFYTYGTSDLVGGAGIQCWRSKDLTNWEYKSVAYTPDFDNCWDFKNHWAPEVIYDASIGDRGGYLMFFNSDYGALDSSNTPWYKRGDNHKYISVVFSEQPYGPFKALIDEYVSKPVYDFSANNKVINNKDKLLARSNTIDAHPYIDPVTGEKYLYYSGYGYDGYGQTSDHWHGQTIFGVKMKDKNWLTPDYSTVVELTNLNKSRPGMTTDDCPEGQNVNEGAFVWRHNNKYYLTFSTFNFENVMYQVRQAVSDSPLGPFIKVKPADGGTLLATEVAWEGKIQSAGHHCFITCGDELMIAYHSFYDRINIANGRAIAIDTVSWVDNSSLDLDGDGTGDGLELMHVNGPTYSYQPLPEEISGYKNLAPQATITSNNTAAGSDVKYLNDGLIKTHPNDLVKEYETGEANVVLDEDGDPDYIRTDITLKFDDYKTVRSIMAYNSINSDKYFMSIAGISLKCKDKDRFISDIPFDYNWHTSDDDAILPGAACIAEFTDIAVKEMTLTFFSEPEMPINISEIKVLGKDGTETAKTGKLGSYKYIPHDPVEAMPHYESETFGSVEDFFKPTDSTPVEGVNYDLESNYGFDMSHDVEGERYIDKFWAGNMQEIYFKDVKGSVLYVEVKMSVLDHLKSYNWDPAPKAGIVVRTRNRTFISYNIDYQSTFDNPFVGYVESNATGNDYQWTGTNGYRSYQVSGLSYAGENYATLGLARVGTKIYMFANGKYVATETASRFQEDEETAVGFVAFNCFTRYKDYSVVTGEDAVKTVLKDKYNFDLPTT